LDRGFCSAVNGKAIERIQRFWRKKMNRFTRFAPASLLALAGVFLVAGCHGKQDQNAANQADQSASTDQSQASDPATANLAPISNASGPVAQGGSDQQADQGSATDNSDTGEQPVATAPDPPPALPEYDQPPAPGDDYLWTPGYWGWASAGYYWVPGVWVQAPYAGALWTPGYWGFVHGHYGFFNGYWGPHIGFYGGVNYGFGYVGLGYQGGYWNSGHFFYNRAVNNINVTIIHNVYSHPVPVNNVRVSFNGGQGGIAVRPRPAELAAFREPHAAPMRAQVQNEHAASLDRAQFVSVNHGKPANAVIAKPLAADRGVHPVARPEARNVPEHAAPEARPNPAGHPAARPEAAPRPAERPAPHAAERPAPHETERPAARPAEHPAPHQAERPAQHPAEKRAPKPAPEHPKKPEAGRSH
jgi:hypothetical protein